MQSKDIESLAYIILTAGLLVSAVAALIMIVKAARSEDKGMAILIFLVALCGVPIFAYRNWDLARKTFFAWLFGILLIPAGAFLFPIANKIKVGELERGLKTQPNDPRMNDDLAFEYYKRGDYAAALPLMKKALANEHKLRKECAPADYKCRRIYSNTILPNTLTRLERHKEAVVAWRRLMNRGSTISNYDQRDFGISLHAVGRKREASKIFFRFCTHGHTTLCNEHKDKILPGTVRKYCVKKPWTNPNVFLKKDEIARMKSLCAIK